MLTSGHQPPATGDVGYRLIYRLTASTVEITAIAGTPSSASTPLCFILPVVSPRGETLSQPDPKTIQISKPGGVLIIRTDTAHGFDIVPKERTFNLVPGFECVPVTLAMQPGMTLRIRLETS